MRVSVCLATVTALTLLLSPNGRAENAEERSAAQRMFKRSLQDFQALTARAYAGNAQAQYALARLYEEGKGGIKRDLAYALSWYEEAARNGLKIAIKKIQKLETQSH